MSACHRWLPWSWGSPWPGGWRPPRAAGGRSGWSSPGRGGWPPCQKRWTEVCKPLLGARLVTDKEGQLGHMTWQHHLPDCHRARDPFLGVDTTTYFAYIISQEDYLSISYAYGTMKFEMCLLMAAVSCVLFGCHTVQSIIACPVPSQNIITGLQIVTTYWWMVNGSSS